MTKIHVNEYVCQLPAVRNVTRELLAPYRDIVVTNRTPEEPDSYYLSWGDPVHKCKTGTMETGFFWDAVHIDTIGLYAHSTLNTAAGRDAILSFRAPKSATEIILGGRLPPSKYRQAVGVPTRWEGIVLALQNPSDRSIHRGSSTEDYYSFVQAACRHYGRRLFLKLHPWNSGDVEKRFREMAAAHECTIGRVDHSVILQCKFVLVYNSTFVVDSLLRGTKTAQFAPGYFYQCPGVTYTAFQFPDELPDLTGDGHKLCDFLAWRYCFSQAMSTGRIVEVLRRFAKSSSLFPLREEDSYASYCLEHGQQTTKPTPPASQRSHLQ